MWQVVATGPEPASEEPEQPPGLDPADLDLDVTKELEAARANVYTLLVAPERSNSTVYMRVLMTSHTGGTSSPASGRGGNVSRYASLHVEYYEIRNICRVSLLVRA